MVRTAIWKHSVDGRVFAGGLNLAGDAASPVVLISAGVGITPLLGMLHALLKMEKTSSPEVWWIHSARDGTHHPFADEVRGLLAGLGRGRSVVFYTRPTANDQRAMKYDAKGRVDIALLQELGMPMSAIFYLCGPAAFMATMISGLRERGIPAAHIRTELFGPAAASSDGKVLPAPHRPDGKQGSGPIVTFIRSGISVRWGARFGSLLELAEACDVPVRWSCRSGVCHTCECGLIDGEIEYSPDPLDRPAKGLALICCTTPKTGVDLDL
jgi:ferredoxin